MPHPGVTSDTGPTPEHGEDSYVGTGRLRGRRAIVTGGDSGIGRAVVIACAREGADVLVDNAAHQMSIDGIEDLSTEQLLRTFTTNVFATVWLSRAAVPHFAPGSSTIDTVSVQADSPSSALLDHAMARAALVNSTLDLAQEVGEKGIRVNAVAPGPVWTPLIPATMPAEQVEDFGTQTPLGRAGQPAELAPAHVFLASQESSCSTGTVIRVAGGK